MIKALTVTNPYGEPVRIVLANEDARHGLLIKSIDGLGPAKANINVVQMATLDGSYYNSARLDQRNIVIGLIFNGDIENARLNTYEDFPIKGEVKLEIETDRRTVYTKGYVESNEPDIFSKQEEAQISIICPDPYFYDVESVQISGMAHSSSSDSGPSVTSIELRNRCDLPIGFDATFEIREYGASTGDHANISIRNIQTGQIMQISDDYLTYITESSYLPGGFKLHLSTRNTEKRILLETTPGFYINVINALGINPDWMYLERGFNDIEIEVQYPYQLEYEFNWRHMYEGV